jgi:hypothetical protein
MVRIYFYFLKQCIILNSYSFKICSRFGRRLVGKVALKKMGQAHNQRSCVGLVVQALFAPLTSSKLG